MLPIETLKGLILNDAAPIQFFKTANAFKEDICTYPEDIQKMYEFDKETRMYNLPEPEWLKWRQHGPFYYDSANPHYIELAIGGSSIAALYDGSELSKSLKYYDGQHGSNFSSASELYCSKRNITLPLSEPKNPDVLWTGHNEEQSTRDLFLRKYQKDNPFDIVKVYNDTHLYQCGAKDSEGKLLHPYVLCNLDGIVSINGLEGVLECKTCNRGSEDYDLWKQGIVPLKYYLQVCWYMACMNMPYAYIICKWGIGMNNCTYIYIERDFTIESMIMDMVDEFVDCVKKGVEPSHDGQSVERLNVYYRRKMGDYKPNAPVLNLEPYLAPVLCHINDIDMEISALKDKINALESEKTQLLVADVFPCFTDENKGVLEVNSTSFIEVDLKNEPAKPEIDVEKVKRELPAIYDKYTQYQEFFNASLFIKENKDLVEPYRKDNGILTESKKNYCKVRFVNKEVV